MYHQKHLIIGAGPIGLAHAKALKEHNISYDQVEADDDVGGNWYHGTYETAHIISSKKVTEYSDWPMPDTYPDFPSQQNMLDYFRAYTQNFGLRENIEFNKKVVYVRPIEKNLWEVHFEDGETRNYKGVLVCNGHHWKRRFPQYEGNFDGEWLHSKDYKRPEQLKGKRVLVIGGGNSACDIASEAARVSQKAIMSMRSGVWFLPKTLLGQPLTDSPFQAAPIWLQRSLLRLMLKIVVGDLSKYGLQKPDYKIFDKHPTVSTEVLHYIKHGRIEAKPAIKRLAGRKVIFEDGTSQNFDAIVCATGYHVSYPFLPKELNRIDGSVVKVYAGSLLEDYKGLYLIGWAQARGGIGSLITPSADLLAKMIHLQDSIKPPLGLVIKQTGEKLPTTHLVSPTEVKKRLKKANRRWWMLEKVARRVDSKHQDFENKVLSTMPKETEKMLKQQTMQVF
ncbi:MAG: flavin-containing monooxygenase [Chitinophagales bacterium]